MIVPEIDWTKHDEYPRNIIECGCGQQYYSHSKAVSIESEFVIITREKCPRCHKCVGNAYRVSSSPEVMAIGK